MVIIMKIMIDDGMVHMIRSEKVLQRPRSLLWGSLHIVNPDGWRHVEEFELIVSKEKA